MRTELVSVPTDTVPLDGAWYTPSDSLARGGVLLLHGNTMNFYVGAPRFLPPALVEAGYACLAFNRRSHDILSTRDSRTPEGGAYQTAAQDIADNDYATAWLVDRGFAAPVVIGHSNGGMLGARFAATHPETRALVLLSAHIGGPEIVPLSCAAGQLAADRLDEVIAEAEQLVAEGRGDALLCLPGWWYVLSAAGFLDRLRHTPDLLEDATSVRCPSLFVRGDEESRTLYPAEEFSARTRVPCTVEVVGDCDHFYRGREDEVARLVVGWLHRVDPYRTEERAFT
jgi:pimeloyl-ACP methyl ester carboxylesterase